MKRKRRKFDGPVGDRIRTLREAKKMSQTDLAETVDVTWTAVSHWECGGALPDVGRLSELAEALGITVTELIAGEKAFGPLAEMLEAAS